MPEVTAYAPGTFCWPELGTSDAAAAKSFYTALFGWKANDMPAGPDSVYTMLQKGEKDVGALYGLNAQQKAAGVPPHWLSYVSVTSVDDTVGRAKSLGGKVVLDPMDVFDVGRMAGLQDPTGAAFAVWQPRAHIGARLVNEPGAPCWNELATNDTPAAEQFYTRLFGWAAEPQPMGPMKYTLFKNGGQPAGGLYAITPEMGSAPPHWMVYFAVDDCDGSTERATRLGARTIVPPSDIPGIGRFAILFDPQGAAFAIIRLIGR